MDKIEELLNNPKTDLQKQALTDKSYKKTPNNQDCKINFELATYGDVILKCALCKIYFERENKDNFGFKGKLTEWKKQYESDEVLIKFIARHYDILNFLNFDSGDTKKPQDYKYEVKMLKEDINTLQPQWRHALPQFILKIAKVKSLKS